jgi:hypothetical protein
MMEDVEETKKQTLKFEILDEFGRSYDKWIQDCYLHRMREILTNPTEFGKTVLEQKKSDHCIQNADICRVV